jgi:hypothetical protein
MARNTQVNCLNSVKIVSYAVILLVLNVCTSLVFGNYPDVNKELTAGEIAGFLLSTYVPYVLAVTTVLAIFVRGQTRFSYLQALCVVAVSELLARLVLFVVGWVTPLSPFWLLDYLVLGVSTVAGIAIGVWLRTIKQRVSRGQSPDT